MAAKIDAMAIKIAKVDGGLWLSIRPSWGFQNCLILTVQFFGIAIFLFVATSGFEAGARGIGILAGLVFLILWAGFWFTSNSIIVTRSSFKRSQTLFGFEFSNSEYVNSMVQPLRYEEWAGNRMTNTGIRFEYDGGTVTIAKRADRPTPGI